MFRIEVVQSPAQLKTFFKFSIQKSHEVEDRLLKNIIRRGQGQAKFRLWLAYDGRNNQCSGRIAAHSSGNKLGYLSSFNVMGERGPARQLIEKAVKFLQDEGVNQILGPELPWPYLSKGIKEGDPLVEDFCRLGFLPHQNWNLIQERLSSILKRQEQVRLGSHLSLDLHMSPWSVSNWDKEIAAACNVLNRDRTEHNYITELTLEESILAHSSPAELLAFTAYLGPDPLAFVMGKKHKEKVARFERIPQLLPRTSVKNVDFAFFEIASNDLGIIQQTEIQLWKFIGKVIGKVNQNEEDPMVCYRGNRCERSLNKIVFSKILRTQAA